MVSAGFRRRRAARHGADRGPARRCSGRWPTSRCSASTATAPAGAPPTAPSISRCRCCKPGKSLRFAACPQGQDPDDLYPLRRPRGDGRGARRRAPALRRAVDARDRSGRARHAGAPRRASRRGSARCSTPSATRPCASTTAANSATGCASCSRRALAPAREGWRKQAWAKRPGATIAAATRAPAAGLAGRRGLWPACRSGRRARAFRDDRRRCIRGREPAACRKPDVARLPLGHPAPRGADPAGGDQSPLAAARPSGRAVGGRIPGIPTSPSCKGALIDIFADDGTPDRELMVAELARRGFGELSARVAKAITTVSVWGAGQEAGAEDVLMTWRQLIALHRQWHSLIKEPKTPSRPWAGTPPRPTIPVAGRQGSPLGP